jgi:hypothetical protein
MNRDELKGKGEQLKGKVKQGVGDLTDNDRLKRRRVRPTRRPATSRRASAAAAARWARRSRTSATSSRAEDFHRPAARPKDQGAGAGHFSPPARFVPPTEGLAPARAFCYCCKVLVDTLSRA